MSAVTIAAWDAGEASERALEWAARRETAGGRPLHVLRILPPFEATSAAATSKLDLVAARGRLHDRLDRLRAAHPGLVVDGGVACGDVVEELRVASAEGNLLVLGQDEERHESSRLRTRVAARLSSLAAGPVVIVPRVDPPDQHAAAERAEQIVVGIDGTRASIAALRFAAEESRESGARLVVAHVWAASGHRDDHALEPDALQSLVNHQHAQLLEESVEIGLTDFPDVDVVRRVVRGDPTVELRRLARGTRLLVAGDHGRGPLARYLLGSVSAALVIDPEVPTVIVHDPSSTGPDAALRSRTRVDA